jgi:hypothetical protein
MMGANCSAPHGHSGTPVCTSDEPMFQTKLVVNLANFTQNSTLFCSEFDMLWSALNSVYVSPDFKDDLVWTAAPTSGYGAGNAPCSGPALHLKTMIILSR